MMSYKKAFRKLCKFIADAQTIDTERHGRWLKEYGNPFPVCSLCGITNPSHGNYCMACGAKMDEEVNE